MDRRWAVGLALAVTVAGTALAADAVMGDWQGTWKSADGKASPLVAQVIALGDGTYQANLLDEFDKRAEPLVVLAGKLDNNKVTFAGKAGDKSRMKGSDWTATVQANMFVGSFQGDTSGTFEMEKTVRLSPTLGAKPPQGAIILFDGTNLDQWEHKGNKPCTWKLTEDGSMLVTRGGIISKPVFTDHKLHVEFKTPFMPKARGQGRGNSGVYLQGRYEVQVLDSYGLAGADNECGGIYKTGRPLVNMCAPPEQWQTYDITFRAPRFDANGQKTENARVTVLHNGVLIQDNIEAPDPTTSCWDRDVAQPGGLHLQDHGNPVEFRNIWAVKIKE